MTPRSIFGAGCNSPPTVIGAIHKPVSVSRFGVIPKPTVQSGREKICSVIANFRPVKAGRFLFCRYIIPSQTAENLKKDDVNGNHSQNKNKPYKRTQKSYGNSNYVSVLTCADDD